MCINIIDAHEGLILNDNYPVCGLQRGTLLTANDIEHLKASGVKCINVEAVPTSKYILRDCLKLIHRNQSMIQVHNLLNSSDSSNAFDCDVNKITMDIINNILSNTTACNVLQTVNDFDKVTYEHSLRVCILSLLTGMHMHLPDSLLCVIGSAAILHDIGKLHVDSNILNKETTLTPQEKEIIAMHPVWGAEAAPVSPYVKTIIRAHHEKYDGTGYPDGLHACGIPLPSRIIAIADVWDALTSSRPYHKPICVDRAIKFLYDNAGTAFDGSIIEHFVQVLRVFPDGAIVMLSDQQIGKVYKQNKNDIVSPHVLVDGKIIDLSKDPRTILCCAVCYDSRILEFVS